MSVVVLAVEPASTSVRPSRLNSVGPPMSMGSFGPGVTLPVAVSSQASSLRPLAFQLSAASLPSSLRTP